MKFSVLSDDNIISADGDLQGILSKWLSTSANFFVKYFNVGQLPGGNGKLLLVVEVGSCSFIAGPEVPRCRV